MSYLCRLVIIYFCFSLGAVYSGTADIKCAIKLSKTLCAKIIADDKLSRKSDSSFKLQISNSNGEELSLVETPEVILWMVMKSGHEHGSDKVSITETEASNSVIKEFHIKNVWFLMIGQWWIKLKIMDNGSKVDYKVPVCIGRSSKNSFVGNCIKK